LNAICSKKNISGFKNIAFEILKMVNIDLSAVDADGYTALYIALKNRHDDIVQKILHHKDLKAFDEIIYYIKTRKYDEALKFIDKNKNEDINGPSIMSDTPLREAVMDGKIDLVKAILENDKIDINRIFYEESFNSEKFLPVPPIWIALMNKKFEIARLLLGHKNKDRAYDIDLSGDWQRDINVKNIPKDIEKIFNEKGISFGTSEWLN
jgi:hypothetical protein